MYQSDLLKGRTIFITGGGTGLGRSMALRCAELGANIFLVARREEPLQETAEAIRAKGGARGLRLRGHSRFQRCGKSRGGGRKGIWARGHAGE